MGDIWIEDCAYCGGIHTNQWAYDECADRNAQAGEVRQSLLDDLRKARPSIDGPEPYN